MNEELRQFIMMSHRLEDNCFKLTDEIELAYVNFLDEPLTIMSVLEFIDVVLPHARIRNKEDMLIKRNEAYTAYHDKGNPLMKQMLTVLIESIGDDPIPYYVHNVAYKLLPLTKGNGTLARALWLKVSHPRTYDFLTDYYFEALRNYNAHFAVEFLEKKAKWTNKPLT